MESLATLEQTLKVTFQSKELFQEAMVHSSYFNEHPDRVPGSNERLEFLGDALLDFVVAEALYQRYPQMSEGGLTALRSALVCGDMLAQVARELRIGEFLYLGQGEEASGGRTRPSNLAGAFEALVGALFLDQGYQRAATFILETLQEPIEHVAAEGVPRDPKSLLQEVVQAQGKPSPLYRLVGQIGPDHAKQFRVEVLVGEEVLGQGSGRRKAEAEREAAGVALQRMKDQGVGPEA